MSELLHTCYRITNIDKSVAFYEALGFQKSKQATLKDGAINTFLNLGNSTNCLELTWNPNVESYTLGTGYGHIAISTPDINHTLSILSEQNIFPEKPPYRVREGGSLLAFVQDPDGYRIELIEKP